MVLSAADLAAYMYKDNCMKVFEYIPDLRGAQTSVYRTIPGPEVIKLFHAQLS